MLMLDKKTKEKLYSYELDESEQSNSASTINSQDIEDMGKLIDPILETSINTENDELDDSILTEGQGEYIEAIKG